MTTLENKSAKLPKDQTADERKKVHENAMQLLKDTEDARMKEQRESNNKMALEIFNSWRTVTDPKHHLAQMDFVSIGITNVDKDVIDQIKKKATELKFKILLENDSCLRIGF